LICIDFCDDNMVLDDISTTFDCSLNIIDANCFSYLPVPSFYGSDVIEVTGIFNGQSEVAFVYLEIDANCDGGNSGGGQTINEAPIANDDEISVVIGVAQNIIVLSNDTDANGDALSVCSMTNPAFGTITDLGNGVIAYTAGPNFSGIDAFAYTACDGNGGEDNALVIVYGSAGKPDNADEMIAQILSGDRDAQRLAVEALELPNVITPNGDGINDAFSVMGNTLSVIGREMGITVFDAYGRTIYTDEEFHLSQAWNPSIDVENGTYFYVLQVLDTNGNPIQRQGFIELRR